MTPAAGSGQFKQASLFAFLVRFFPRQFEPDMERSYRSFYVKLMARLRARSSLVGLVMWSSFLLWDLLRAVADPIFRGFAPELSVVRVLVGVGLYLGRRKALTRRFETDDAYASRVLAFSLVTLYGGMCILSVLAPAPYKTQSFYIGMMLCMVGLYSLFGLRTRQALLMAGFVTVCNIIAISSNDWGPQLVGAPVTPVKFGWLPMVFFICFNVIGITLCVLHEFMTRKLFESQYALARSNQETVRQQSEIIQMKEANRIEAVKRSGEKSLFIASAVHDMRQPVQSLTSAIPPLRSAIDQRRATDTRNMLEIVQRSTQVLRDQLGAILDISRIEAGQVKVSITPVNLSKLLLEVCVTLDGAAKKHAIALNLEQPDHAVLVASDHQFLRRIVSNLVDNGIKYSDPAKRPHGFVRVSLVVKGDVAETMIVDNGIGIEEAAVKDGRIFQPFIQLRNRHPEAEKGVGLGLAIVKGMLDRMPGHELSVVSELGVGSRFSLQLPLAGGEAPFLRPEADQNEVLEKGRLAGTMVLLVEDDDMVRMATQASLIGLGAHCESFASLSELSEGLEDVSRTPDILLTDYRLPDGRTAMDVIQVVSEVFGDVPTILWSGSEPPSRLIAEFPGLLVLRKPVDLPQLAGAMASLLPRSSQQ